MLTLSGIRNGLWCAVAFGIVACASSVAKSSVEPAGQAQAAADKQDAELPGHTAPGSP